MIRKLLKPQTSNKTKMEHISESRISLFQGREIKENKTKTPNEFVEKFSILIAKQSEEEGLVIPRSVLGNCMIKAYTVPLQVALFYVFQVLLRPHHDYTCQ